MSDYVLDLELLQFSLRNVIQMANAIMLIIPYRYEGIWVFDDDRVGLIKEPFVAGIPEMLNIMVQDIKNAAQGFRLLFSANPFPGYQVELNWLREEFGGHWYAWKAQELEGWLCPALFKYFEKAPINIYCKAESK